MTDSESGSLAVVVPVYNEEAVVREFHARLSATLDGIGRLRATVIYVNDGSNDHTLGILRALRQQDSRIAIVNLSRNFGKEIALSAGLDYADADAVIVIDADLQDPPELIPDFLRLWEAGNDVVYGQRVSRRGETGLKKATAYLFYRVIQSLSRVHIPEDTGDFRLLSRRAVTALRSLREQHRYMKGLFSWIGYSQVALRYERAPRSAGTSKFNYVRLWAFALEGITSFSIAPLKIATYLGLGIAGLSFIGAALVFYKAMVYGDPVRGYPSLMVTNLFLSGVQLIGIGVLGEYLGRMFNESKNRPLYFVEEHFPAGMADDARTLGRLVSGMGSTIGIDREAQQQPAVRIASGI
ncbi:prophage-derived bactoprenol glucosyl transferase [Cupriavidus phytorum]|uniref:Prophage-derived bactoprenol glucosyl transferase n=2 Tax=Cupriavidus TaxID=106589 RepID=A0A976AA33_9BURK|nr:MULTISPECIES: glycosyltransferase family 2 protein [Cupriavidus]PZX34673.1 glycosyltransferase involved in cell wall biosynthesis [Cupriavidus alkaliphilus]SOY71147.1 prophage-derived bactoprenol glucosyl transferase [Cupriavidus taiwanensis]